jgi:hypothetical protein
MNKGVLVFARNNSQVDYVKQAYFLAKRVQKYLELPVSLVTDNFDYVKTHYEDYESVFDKVITTEYTTEFTLKRYNDGSLSGKQLEFKNDTRPLAYELTPYDETLLLDSDMVIADSVFNECFNQTNDLLIYKSAYDLANFRDYSEFDYISDTSVPFYWATCVFFRKTPKTKIFFDLIQHIKENWQHYNSVFQLNRTVYRNDHAFSIAIHIMNGYQEGSFAGKMPGKLFYTTDKDILCDVKDESFLFLVEKDQHIGEYTPIRFKDNTVHVMNKFSLNRFIDKELAND